jgi:hypothetical protein
MKNTLGLRAVQDGLANLGVREDPPGSNAGKYVSEYLQFVGLPPGNPWCCAFLVYRIHQAAKELGVTPIVPKTGLVQALYNWAHGKGLVSDTPSPGMAFVEWFPSLGRYAHTGLIAEVQGNKFRTVEGNSNSNGSRDGECVASNWRTWGTGFKAIHLESQE